MCCWPSSKGSTVAEHSVCSRPRAASAWVHAELTVPRQRGIPWRTFKSGVTRWQRVTGVVAHGRAAGFQGFVDRRDAGPQLADLLCSYRGQDALVMGIPRGGVAVAAAVSRSLGVDLDVLVSRKVGVPILPELALGAVTADGAQFMNQALARELGVSEWMFRVLAIEQCAEARRCEQRLRGRRPAPHLAGRTVILVDDGLATGATMRAAIRSVRRAGPARLVVAVPVAAQPTSEAPRPETRPLPD